MSDNIDTLDKILEDYAFVVWANAGENNNVLEEVHNEAKQALNLYIEERIRSCIPQFSDMNVKNADQMEGFRKACLLMEANIERNK